MENSDKKFKEFEKDLEAARILIGLAVKSVDFLSDSLAALKEQASTCHRALDARSSLNKDRG